MPSTAEAGHWAAVVGPSEGLSTPRTDELIEVKRHSDDFIQDPSKASESLRPGAFRSMAQGLTLLSGSHGRGH